MVITDVMGITEITYTIDMKDLKDIAYTMDIRETKDIQKTRGHRRPHEIKAITDTSDIALPTSWMIHMRIKDIRRANSKPRSPQHRVGLCPLLQNLQRNPNIYIIGTFSKKKINFPGKRRSGTLFNPKIDLRQKGSKYDSCF
jgi:hypothetical protein